MNAKIVMEHEEKIKARINKFIEPQLTKKKTIWFINYSQIILKENAQRSVGRICRQILGVKGLESQSGKLLSEKKKSSTNPGNGNFKVPFTNLSLPIGWSSLSQ